MTSEPATIGVVAGPGITPFELDPHNCFACGELNTHGLRLLIHVEPKRAWTQLALDKRFEGWAGIAHGGILATILDEVMAWSLVAEDNWGVTARLSLEFRKPVNVGDTIRATGTIEAARRRVVETSGTIVSAATGHVLATARGTYVAADAARRRELRDRYGFRVADPGAGDTPAAGAERRIVTTSVK